MRLIAQNSAQKVKEAQKTRPPRQPAVVALPEAPLDGQLDGRPVQVVDSDTAPASTEALVGGKLVAIIIVAPIAAVLVIVVVIVAVVCCCCKKKKEEKARATGSADVASVEIKTSV